MLKKCGLILFIFLAQESFSVFDAKKTFEESLQAYDQGKYDQAIRGFDLLFQKNISPAHNLYNLGNAYFRSGRIGEAMASFLEARRLLPRDPDVKVNLNFTKKQIKDQLDTSLPATIFSGFVFWKHFFTSKEIESFFLWSLVGALLVLLCSYFVKSKVYPLRSVGLWGLGFLCIVFVCLKSTQKHEPIWGAVTEKVAKVYSGPQNSNTVLFELHEGAPFVVEETQQDWVKILLSDGKKGWLFDKFIKIYGLKYL